MRWQCSSFSASSPSHTDHARVLGEKYLIVNINVCRPYVRTSVVARRLAHRKMPLWTVSGVIIHKASKKKTPSQPCVDLMPGQCIFMYWLGMQEACWPASVAFSLQGRAVEQRRGIHVSVKRSDDSDAGVPSGHSAMIRLGWRTLTWSSVEGFREAPW